MVPVLVAIHAGLRIGEVSALRIEDICLSKRQIQVDESLNRVMTYKEDGTVCCPLTYQSTKSSRVRKVPMNEELYKALKTYLDTMPRERREDLKAPLFHTRNGNVMEPRRISYHCLLYTSHRQDSLNQLIHLRYHQHIIIIIRSDIKVIADQQHDISPPCFNLLDIADCFLI